MWGQVRGVEVEGESARASSGESGPSSMRSCGWSVSTRPPGTSRRVTRTTHADDSSSSASAWKSAADAASIRCACSTSTIVGTTRARPRARSTTSWSLAARDASASCSTSVDGAISTSSTIAINESHGSRSGWSASISARSRSATTPSGASESTPSSCRNSPRHAEYGVSRVYTSQPARSSVIPCADLRRLGEQPRLAAARLAGKLDQRPRASTRALDRYAQLLELGRPADQRQLEPDRLPCEAPRVGGPTSHAWTGCVLPLTTNGSRLIWAKLVFAPRSTSPVAYTRPAGALAISRAARFTVSPITAYQRR